jgi:hypothetical protein
MQDGQEFEINGVKYTINYHDGYKVCDFRGWYWEDEHSESGLFANPLDALQDAMLDAHNVHLAEDKKHLDAVNLRLEGDTESFIPSWF